MRLCIDSANEVWLHYAALTYLDGEWFEELIIHAASVCSLALLRLQMKLDIHEC